MNTSKPVLHPRIFVDELHARVASALTIPGERDCPPSLISPNTGYQHRAWSRSSHGHDTRDGTPILPTLLTPPHLMRGPLFFTKAISHDYY